MLDENKQQLGVMSLNDALRLAQAKGLDLVEVVPQAVPPVCRIVDFGKFRYELAKIGATAIETVPLESSIPSLSAIDF